MGSKLSNRLYEWCLDLRVTISENKTFISQELSSGFIPLQSWPLVGIVDENARDYLVPMSLIFPYLSAYQLY